MTLKPMNNADSPRRILILESCEPELDPRIKWVAELCATVGRTDVLGFVLETDKPTKEYDGRVYTERVDTADYPSGAVLLEFLSLSYLLMYPKLFLRSFYKMIRRFAYRNLRRYPWTYGLIVFFKERQDGWLHQTGPSIERTRVHLHKRRENEHQAKTADSPVSRSSINPFGRFRRSLLAHYIEGRISNTLFERAKSSSIVPRLIICHDLSTLGAAVKLKDMFGAPVIYDSCELTAGPDSQVSKGQRSIGNSTLDKLIRRADIVVTLKPRTAAYLEQVCGIHNVLCAPDKPQSVGYFDAVKDLYGR